MNSLEKRLAEVLIGMDYTDFTAVERRVYNILRDSGYVELRGRYVVWKEDGQPADESQ
jgi:hypothetical protein